LSLRKAINPGSGLSDRIATPSTDASALGTSRGSVAGARRAQLIGHGEGDRRLADAAWSGDRDEAPLRQLRHDHADDGGASNHACERDGEVVRELRWSGRRGRGLWPRQRRDRRDEAIAAAGNGRYVAIARLAIAEGPAQRGHMDAEIAFLDEGVGPDAGDQLVLADQLTGALDQDGEDVERAATESQRLFAFEQELLRRKQAEGTERDRVIKRGLRLIRHLNLT
jgi:hypothetical protein